MERIRGGWANVPKHLKCMSDLKKMGLKPVGEAKAEVWNRYQWVQLFDMKETVPRSQATVKQLAALEKARIAQIAAQTCSRCGLVVKRKKDLHQGICSWCREQVFIEKVSERAIQLFRSWVDDKSKYLILDTETTGLDDDSEIVDIALIDLDEYVVYESLVKPVCPIPEEATAIHGISNEMVEHAPNWPEIWSQIQRFFVGKVILIYNADFDNRMIRSNCKRHGLPFVPFENYCVMQTYAEYVGSYSIYHQAFSWVSLADAAYDQDVQISGIRHRAKADCITCARIIQKIVGKNVLETKKIIG